VKIGSSNKNTRILQENIKKAKSRGSRTKIY